MKKIGSRQTKKIIAFLLCWFGIYCLYEALNFSPPIDLPKRKGDFGPALEDIRFNLVEESDPFVNISHLQTSLFYWKHQPVLKVPSNPIVFKGHDSSHKERFITFEYDCGGWNNVRLQIELLVSFAHLYNRTLVLPKPKKLYLLGKDGDVMSFDSFFDSSVINGSMINIMPWKEFDSLLYERGILFKNESAQQNDKRRESFLRNECYNPKHSPEHDDFQCIPDCEEVKRVHSKTRLGIPGYKDYIANGLYKPSIITEKNNEEILHFQTPADFSRRWLYLFYVYNYFADPEWHWYYVSLMTRNVYYRQEFFEVSATIVQRLRRILKGKPYATVHIRKGEFQFSETQLSANQILRNIKPLIEKANIRNIYIATDESDKMFFQPFFNYFDNVFFLDTPEINPFRTSLKKRFAEGIIDQIVCATGHLFVGTVLSTFSSYITRLRYLMDSQIAPDKSIYFTTYAYTGDDAHDKVDNNSTWMHIPGRKEWIHMPYFREFADFLTYPESVIRRQQN